MSSANAFASQGGQFHAPVTATPTATPFQVLTPDGAMPVMRQFRIVVANTTSGLVHLAFGPTAQIASNIAAAGTPASNVQTPSAQSPGGLFTFLGSEVEVLSVPGGSFFAVWCGTGAATADMFLTPGEGV